MKRSPKVKTPGPKRRLVFLSHGSKDVWVATQLARQIKRRGATVFLDAAAIAAGGETDEIIREALNVMDEIVVLLTPWSITRPYVWSELGVAWNRRVPIMGLVYGLSKEELQQKPEIPHFLKATNLKDLNEVDDYLESLAHRTKRRSKP